MKIEVGKTEFRSSHADSNPLWRVTEKRGRGTWIATVIEDEWKGTCKAFSTEEITASISMENFWKNITDKSDNYYKNLKVGNIVHYKNGRNAFVRCEVTQTKQLIPKALVGNWSKYDLPQRYRDGSISLGYYGTKIQDKTPFQPDASNIWEHTHNANELDPRTLEPISLEVPPMTQQEEATAKLWQKVDKISKLIKQNNNDPLNILSEIFDEVSFLL